MDETEEKQLHFNRHLEEKAEKYPKLGIVEKKENPLE